MRTPVTARPGWGPNSPALGTAFDRPRPKDWIGPSHRNARVVARSYSERRAAAASGAGRRLAIHDRLSDAIPLSHRASPPRADPS